MAIGRAERLADADAGEQLDVVCSIFIRPPRP